MSGSLLSVSPPFQKNSLAHVSHLRNWGLGLPSMLSGVGIWLLQALQWTT